jgi:predicted O-methyltransferase YrrM
MYLPGHYHSPVPHVDQVASYLKIFSETQSSLVDIDLNVDHQRKVLERFAAFYGEMPFTEEAPENNRYAFNQSWFCYADAIFLYCFLRAHRPKRIIEVGSGYSTAVILDTVDSLREESIELTCIEPNPDRLRSLIRGHEKVHILEREVQSVPISEFSKLGHGDLLFIDSSHVLKAGSDVQYLFNKILPTLSPGTFVHFHDIFYPFEYPSDWLNQGRYWNECYFLHSFLAYNDSWKIHFFNHFIGMTFKDYIQHKMPLCARNSGGSIYLQRIKG